MNRLANGASKKSIAFVVAAPVTAEAFLAPHIRNLADHYQITVIGKRISQSRSLDPRVNLIDIDIERRIDLKSDFMATFALLKILRRQKFDLVQSMTPKAGLLTALAGFAARIPIRIHWFTGQVWATKSGLTREFLKNLDRITAILSTHLLVDSKSQRELLANSHIAKPNKMTVLANGSTRGVDCSRYAITSSVKGVIRQSLGINEKEKVILFVGRLNSDKGVGELLEAFSLIPETNDTHLILVGHDEEGFTERFSSDEPTRRRNIHFVGHQENIIDYLIDSDIFALPSFREGLPVSMLEAGAVGLPLVGTTINGITDIVENNVNGVLIPAGDTMELFHVLNRLILDTTLCTRLGQEAARSIKLRFSEDLLLDAYQDYVSSALSSDRAQRIK